MAMTPARTTDADEIKRLHERIDELERKTLSNLAVTDSNGIRRFQVNDQGVVIRDATGAAIMRNYNTSGWGNAYPTGIIPLYRWNDVLDPLVQTNVTDSTYRSKWFGYFQVSHPRVSMSFVHQISGGTATGQYKVSWYDPNTAIDTTMFESAVRGPGSFSDSPVFTLPQSTHQSIIGIRIMARMPTGVNGVDWCAASARGVLLQGD